MYSRGLMPAALSLLLGCASGQSVDPQTSFCGDSFCIDGIPQGSVQTTSPVHDAKHHVVIVPKGVLHIVELNFPDVDDQERELISDLPHLKAWYLTSAAKPEVLVFVGAEWPYWLFVTIEGEDAKREDLVNVLKRLAIKEVASRSRPGQSD